MVQAIDIQTTTVVFSLGSLVAVLLIAYRVGYTAGKYEDRFQANEDKIQGLGERLGDEIRVLRDAQSSFASRDEFTERLRHIQNMLEALVRPFGATRGI